MEPVVLCASSAYEETYYLNSDFDGLPEAVKDELKIMCVMHTAQVGGILSLEFDEAGHLLLKAGAEEGDLLYDEIGSDLKIKELRRTRQELLKGLELFYRAFILKQDISLE